MVQRCTANPTGVIPAGKVSKNDQPSAGAELHPGGTHFPAIAGFFHAFTFVVLSAPFTKSQTEFDEAPLKKNGKGDQRQAVIFSCFRELANFPPIHQQFTLPLSLMIKDAGLGVFCDVAIDQPDFPVINACVGFFDRDFVIPHAFNFAASQHHPAVQFIKDVVLMTSAAIGTDDHSVCIRYVGFAVFFLFRRCHIRLRSRIRPADRLWFPARMRGGSFLYGLSPLAVCNVSQTRELLVVLEV